MNSSIRSITTWLAGLTLVIASVIVAEGSAGPGSFDYGTNGEKSNAACLSCHKNPNRVGTKRTIDITQFGHTTHSKFGCKTCHDGVGADHPNGRSVAATTGCYDCHEKEGNVYEKSSHAKNARCTGCHNPHQVFSPEEISADAINAQCGNCHDKLRVEAQHARWLPQADLHMAMMPCVTCHSMAKDYTITLYITKHGDRVGGSKKYTAASFKELRELAGTDDLQKLIDSNGDNYISLDELRRFNKEASRKKIFLKGMITPVGVTHEFQTFDDRWDCTFCHVKGKEAMQKSSIALPQPDGTFTTVAIEKGAVLDALRGIPDFYLMGSTRNDTLSYLGLAIIVGGMLMPIGHGTLRFLTRKNRNGKEK